MHELRRRLGRAGAIAATLLAVSGATADASRPHERERPRQDRLTMVFVLDGLRPDSISPSLTPNLFRLREQGVNYVNSHAIVPTVTRVNATVLGTGMQPSHTGIVGNAMYVPGVNAAAPFDTGDATNLYRLDEVTGGRMVLVRTLAERLAARGKQLVSIGSGSSGATLLLNPRAPRGVGVMINAGAPTVTAPFAFPASVGEEIVARFGRPPSAEGDPNANVKVDYAEQVLRDYVLPELEPDVVLNWLTEPDGSQHAHAAGSPESLDAIRNDDRQIGLVMERVRELGLARRTDVIVVSDHGFSLNEYTVGLAEELVDAGLKGSLTSDDVVVANTGASLVYVKDHDPDAIRRIAEFVQQQPWADALFTAAGSRVPGDPRGTVAGTFSLDLIHQANAERGADLIVTYRWTSNLNPFGVPGTATSGGASTGPVMGTSGSHGSFSPWDITNTFFVSGPSFKRAVMTRTPAGNADVAPTIAALQGLSDGRFDGRVLDEALNGRRHHDRGGQHPVRTRTYVTEAQGGQYRAAVEISEVRGRYRYLDSSYRMPPP